MKTILLIAALFFCMSASTDVVAAISTTSNEDSLYVNSEGEVRLYYFGKNVKAQKPGTYKAQKDTNGNCKVYYNDRWYNATESDKSGYRYMIYADKTYYFNF